MSEQVTADSLSIFMKEFRIKEHCKCFAGIGIGSTTDTELGFVFYFETAQDYKNFPYKNPSYNGIPIYKHVTGKVMIATSDKNEKK